MTSNWQFSWSGKGRTNRDMMDHYGIEFDSWPENGKKLRLRLHGFAKRAFNLDGWTCDYDLRKGTFDIPADLKKQNAKAVDFDYYR